MSGRRRKDHHLPTRVYFNRGCHWYVDPGGGWHKLGRQWDRHAKQKWVELSAGNGGHGTVAKLLDDFLVWTEGEVRDGRRSPLTHEGNLLEAEALKMVFGRTPAHAITKRHVASYLKKRSSAVRANREIALLSSAYSWSMSRDEWAMIEENPCYGVRRNKETPRKNYVESRALAAFGKNHCPRWLRAYLVLKRIAGLRQGDMLRLMKPASGEGWIKAYIGKVKKQAKLKRTWGVERVLRTLEADHRQRGIVSVFLFPNSRSGGELSSRGFKSAWARAMKEWKGQPFTENDIRAKAASDASSLDQAQQMLGHETPTTTQRHYRAGVVKIRPRR